MFKHVEWNCEPLCQFFTSVEARLTPTGVSKPRREDCIATQVEFKWCKSTMCNSTMKRNPNQKAKSLRATREITRLKNQVAETRCEMSGPPRPLVFNQSPALTAKRRFVQNGAVSNQAFTLANGHDQFLVVTNSATGGAVCYADCWWIKKIELWAISEGNLPTTATITPVGADLDSNMFNDREQAFVIQSRSTADPAYMKIVPKRNSPLGGVHFSSNVNVAGTLFQCNIGTSGGSSNFRCTMDITFGYVLNLVGLPLGYGVVTATTTLGTLGARGILSGFQPSGINNLG